MEKIKNKLVIKNKTRSNDHEVVWENVLLIIYGNETEKNIFILVYMYIYGWMNVWIRVCIKMKFEV